MSMAIRGNARRSPSGRVIITDNLMAGGVDVWVFDRKTSHPDARILRLNHIAGEFTERWEELKPESDASAAPTFTLEDHVAEELRDLLTAARPPAADDARAHLADAVGIRDRLLTLVEHVINAEHVPPAR